MLEKIKIIELENKDFATFNDGYLNIYKEDGPVVRRIGITRNELLRIYDAMLLEKLKELIKKFDDMPF